MLFLPYGVQLNQFFLNKMSYLITSIVSLLIGFLAGILVGRNNAKKVETVVSTAKQTQERGKYILDVLKGRKNID